MGDRRYFPAFRRVALLAVTFLSGLVGCGEPISVSNLNGGKIELIGHAGAGLHSRITPLQGNSSPSLNKALYGYRTDGVEIDLQLTRDRIVVLFHDPRLEESTNCSGAVPDKTFAELRACKYQHTLAIAGEDDRILSLQQAMASFAARTPRPKVYFDLKAFPGESGLPADFDQAFMRKLAEIITAYSAYDWIHMQSGRINLYREARARLGHKVKLLYDAHTMTHGLAVAEREGVDGLVIEQEHVTRAQIQEAHRRGLWVVLYNIRSVVSARHAAESWPDAVQTDNIQVMQDVLGE